MMNRKDTERIQKHIQEHQRSTADWQGNSEKIDKIVNNLTMAWIDYPKAYSAPFMDFEVYGDGRCCWECGNG